MTEYVYNLVYGPSTKDEKPISSISSTNVKNKNLPMRIDQPKISEGQISLYDMVKDKKDYSLIIGGQWAISDQGGTLTRIGFDGKVKSYWAIRNQIGPPYELTYYMTTGHTFEVFYNPKTEHIEIKDPIHRSMYVTYDKFYFKLNS
jgi:hypothetical protein